MTTWQLKLTKGNKLTNLNFIFFFKFCQIEGFFVVVVVVVVFLAISF